MVAHVEGALAGTHETLTANHTALLIRFFLVVLALSLNGQVTILQLSLDIALLKALPLPNPAHSDRHIP